MAPDFNQTRPDQAPPALEDIRQKMRRDWDRRAEVDPRYWVAATAEADEASYDASAQRDTAQLLSHLQGRLDLRQSQILDVGCGIGRLTAPLADHCAAVVGVDVSARMIEEARQLHRRPNLSFETTSGVDLQGFASDRFDGVFSFSVLPHLPPDVVACYFAEISRVLRPGGWFVYQFWVGPSRPAAENDTLTIRVYDEDTLDRLHRDSGLTRVETRQMTYFDPVLALHPVWIVARKDHAPDQRPQFDPMRAAAASSAEQSLESGLMVYLALKQGERGEISAAERALAKALEADPTRGEAYIQWASHRLDADDLEGAAALFERMVTVLPMEPLGWLYRAEAALALGQGETAQIALSRLYALPDLPDEIAAHAARLTARLAGQ